MSPTRSNPAPAPLQTYRWLWQPWLYVALSLHAAALLLPWPERWSQSLEPEPEEETVQITLVETPAEAGSELSQPPADSAVTPTATPQPAQAAARPLAPPETFAPEATPPATPRPRGAAPSPAAPAAPGRQASGPRDFFAAFPRYPDAQPGSGGLLRPEFERAAYLYQTGDDLGAIAQTFQQTLLPGSGFTWQVQAQEAHFRVYHIQRETGEAGYLHLIRQDGRTALYLEAQPYTLAQLREATTEPMDNDAQQQFLTQFSMALYLMAAEGGQYTLGDQQLRAREAELLGKLADPAPFLANGRLDRERFQLQGALRGRTSTQVSAELSQALTDGYDLARIDRYGEGELYKVTSDDAHIYLILAQAQDEVVILSTNRDPRPS